MITMTLYMMFVVVCFGFMSLAYMLLLTMKAIDKLHKDVMAIGYYLQAKEWLYSVESGDFSSRFPEQKE